MPCGVDLIINRNARKLAGASALRRRLLAEAARAGVRAHETHTARELDRVAQAIAARGTDAVILAGGDGSSMLGATALARAFAGVPLPPIAFAPAGTVSTIARNAGLRGAASAERVLRAVAGGRGRPVAWPTMRVRDDRGGEHVGFIFGAGLVARFFEVYERSEAQGLGPAARIAARVFVGSIAGSEFARRILDPAPCALTVDGARHPASAWSLVVASVLRDVGLHMRVTYRGGQDLGRFHVVASGLPAGALGPQMPRVMAGRPLKGEPRIDALAVSLRIDFTGQAGAYVLDGELLSAHSVTVEPGPALTLLLA